MISSAPRAALALLALSLGSWGCGGMILGGGGVWSHGGGLNGVEETVHASLGLAGAEEDARGAIEVAGEAGFGQRLDGPGETRRYSVMLDARYHPRSWSRGAWGAFWLAGLSWEFFSAEGFRDQMGGFARVGVGGTGRIEYTRSAHGLWAGALLEGVFGALATVKATSAAEAAAPELPTAAYGGVRLSLLFEWWGYTTTR